MFWASNAHHQESLTVHTASSFCVCVCLRHCLVRNCFLQDSAADRHKHRNWRLYVRWGTPDDERLTLKTCRVINIWIENKNLLQVASVGLLIWITNYIFPRYEKSQIHAVDTFWKNGNTGGMQDGNNSINDLKAQQLIYYTTWIDVKKSMHFPLRVNFSQNTSLYCHKQN
jgi:hypothetical protein